MPIQAVSEAIRDLLERAINDAARMPPGTFTVYLGPPDADTEQDDELILFPMRLTPSADLRNVPRVRPFPDAADAPVQLDEAVPLELHYLVTAGSPQNPTAAAGALRRLGHAVRAIEAASPMSVPAYFQDAVFLSLEPLSADELSRIWAMFPNFNGRTCFTFRASPVWIDPAAPPVEAAPVIFDEARHRVAGGD